MAKNKNFVRYIFLVVALVSGSLVHAQLSVRDIYTAELGVRERTGQNDGTRVELYLKSCGLKMGNPWCAAFVTWCYKQAGIKTVVSAYSPNWFPAKYTVYTKGKQGNKTPKQADVFGIWFANKGRIAHVGFVDEWEPPNSHCITVEGNTNEAGSREGDGVYRKRRLKSQIYKVSRWL